MVIQSVHAEDGMSSPVCRKRLKFVEPEIGHTRKFCCPPATIVSPLIVQSVVVAVGSSETDLYDVVSVVLTLKKRGWPPVALFSCTVLEIVK